MKRDAVDEMNDAWRRELPGLDPSALGIIGRVLVLARHLERSVTAALEAHGLSLGQFDILATLRRQGPRGQLTPSLLMKSVMLSSGGMTNRLDRLEEAGLLKRLPDPADRRGVVVALTAKGCTKIEAAAQARMAEARASLPDLPLPDRKILTDLLRRWLASLSDD